MRQHDELTPEEKVKRAQDAQRLLSDPLLKEAFANIRLNYFEAWANCPPEKVNERDAIFHAARVMSDVESHLHVVLTSGKLEQGHIDRVARRRG